MPELQAFRNSESYYATATHEITHWTRHPSRLDRSFDQKRFGDSGYAMEELVAEIGAAFLCADLEITPKPREDHAAYIASWLNLYGVKIRQGLKSCGGKSHRSPLFLD